MDRVFVQRDLLQQVRHRGRDGVFRMLVLAPAPYSAGDTKGKTESGTSTKRRENKGSNNELSTKNVSAQRKKDRKAEIIDRLVFVVCVFFLHFHPFQLI